MMTSSEVNENSAVPIGVATDVWLSRTT